MSLMNRHNNDGGYGQLDGNGSFKQNSQNGDSSRNAYTTKLDKAVESNFLEILKAGIKLGMPIPEILDIHSPMGLGPIVASPMGALAGAILASAGKLANNTSALVQDFGQGLKYDGIVERAILGEAAFNVVLATKRLRLEELGILDGMAKIVKQLSPTANKIAPFIMHTLTAVALRVSLDALHNECGAKTTLAALSYGKTFQTSNGTLDPEAEVFIGRLLKCCSDQNGTQGCSRDREMIIQIGFREAGPVLTNVNSSGLNVLSTALPASASGEEKGDVAHVPYIEGLPERAMLGEAALQTLMKVPSRNLDDSVFDIMASSIAKIGDVVRMSSPGLMEDIGFLVKGIVTAPAAGGLAAPFQQSGFQPVTNFDGNSASNTRRMKGLSVNLETEMLNWLKA